MEDHPSVLQIRPPRAASRGPAGSISPLPNVESAELNTLPVNRPPLGRYNTSGSNRLSQLFPNRPSLAAAPSPNSLSSRRTSHPSPIAAATETSCYIPHAPAPPSLPEDTSYNTTPDTLDQAHTPRLVQKSGTRHLLNRLASLKSSRHIGKDYNKIHDEEGGRFGDLEEEDYHVLDDLSGYDSHPLKTLQAAKKFGSQADALEHSRDMDEARYVAEYERLEAQLGAGMEAITEVPFTHGVLQKRAQSVHKHSASEAEAVDAATSQAAQHEAEKTGGIVAMADIPLDISDTFGGDFDARSILATNQGNDDFKTSYYFPKDPDMPSWRPYSMGWPYLSGLVIVALTAAILQEFLCQKSINKVKENSQGGLITFTKAGDLSLTAYFTWKYAPVLFLVSYGILWQISDFDIKRLEPFYQLSKPTGATASESLNMDYVTFMSCLVPFRAWRHRQYAVMYVSVCTLLASGLVPILQSASVIMYPPQNERETDEPKSIRIDPVWSRLVTVTLIIVALLGSVLMYEMRRKSGLLSDPKGIAGIATMATRSHILADFNGLDIAPLHKIHKQLRHRRYILHKSTLWQGEYIRNSKEKIPDTGSDPRPIMLRLQSGISYISYLILFTIAIPIFMFVEGANEATERLPWLLTAMATVAKLLWNTTNSDIRMLEPFYILSHRHAPAKTLTLDYTGTNPIFLPIKALLNKHYVVALVGMGSVLAEVLTVCVSSFSVDGKKFIPGHGGADTDGMLDYKDRYNSAETFRSFWISFALVLGILVFLISIACMVYVRRAHRFMPRKIGTMASVLAFIHQSKMLVSFVDTEALDSAQMTEHLEKQNKTYGLGWFSGRDSDDHCGIDEEELLASYEYGKDWTKTRVLGHQIGAWEQW